MTDKYILKDRKPVPADLMTWANWFETADRKVARTIISNDCYVSTVFLGIDHNFFPERGGIPIVFETMIFGGPENLWQDRYSTWEDAEAGHAKAVEIAAHATQAMNSEESQNE